MVFLKRKNNLLGVTCPTGQIWHPFLNRCVPDPNYHPGLIDPNAPGGVHHYQPPIWADPGPYTPPANPPNDGTGTGTNPTDSNVFSTPIFGIPLWGWGAGLAAYFLFIK